MNKTDKYIKIIKIQKSIHYEIHHILTRDTFILIDYSLHTNLIWPEILTRPFVSKPAQSPKFG